MSFRAERPAFSAETRHESSRLGFIHARNQMLLCSQGEMSYAHVRAFIDAGAEFHRTRMYEEENEGEYIYEEDARSPEFIERRKEFRIWRDASFAMNGEESIVHAIKLLSREQAKARRDLKEAQSAGRLAEIHFAPSNGSSYKATIYRREMEIRGYTRAMKVVAQVSIMEKGLIEEQGSV
ncbi:hypothetical protein A2801_02445 [Candidatus Woesebacteria bacterium RIFCSPHIGHO2_01_FULL_41_10]|uniref:Uncharacterized protein n=1 Tax=Candidatus Woesebacteria bacterium RIFCSPHIGHO2_01_FULL_41_10 TaxID=1802500 RepID=A0A1F7YLR9_9BACT|nr:MAG: hypothetical protein A2801_02445 [Candidatus Woesebacteria bacterium RIFCSPHIGHO2_01_FULL_41_10]